MEKVTAVLRENVTKRRVFTSLILGILIGTVLFLFLLLGFLGIFAYSYLRTFTTQANIPISELSKIIRTGLTTEPKQTENRVNILLLGTDGLANRVGDRVLTDTMMILSLNLKSGQLHAISLPRDTWHSQYLTKINSLYFYGQERYPDAPQRFTEEVIEEMTGVSIHHTILLSLDTVAQVIDSIGGVDIEVPESFTDDQFPRSDVDIKTEREPAKLYQSVTFTKGNERMNGERALQYIRSRKSLTVDQGNDEARAKRQQQVIASLIKKISDPSVMQNPSQLGQLYKLYRQEFEKQLATVEVIAILNELRSKVRSIQFAPSSLSISQNNELGVLSHPPVDVERGWIYEITDEKKFMQEVQSKLNIFDSQPSTLDVQMQ